MAIETVIPGARPAWFCEYDDAPSRILAHHYPEVPNHVDLTTVDWTTVEPVEIVSAGYPCQPFSAAGRRKGTTDERHLWPYIREAIRVLRPRYVVLENVAGHRSLGFDRVLGDMAEDGMHVRWTSIRASDIGAPHHRERLFILATPADTVGGGWGPGAEQPGAGSAEVAATVGGGAHASDTSSCTWGIGDGNDVRIGRGEGQQQSPTGGGGSPDSDIIGSQEGHQRAIGYGAEVAVTDGGRRALPDADGIGRVGRRPASLEAGRAHATTDRHGPGIEWGAYASAVRRWEHLTRPAPSPTEPNTKGKPRLNAAFAEWMMGLPAGHVCGTCPAFTACKQLREHYKGRRNGIDGILAGQPTTAPPYNRKSTP